MTTQESQDYHDTYPDFKFEIPKFNFSVIDTPDGIYDALKQIEDSKLISFDFETTGLDYVVDRPVGISLGTKEHSWYFHGEHILELITPWLKKRTASQNIQWAGHNTKFDLHHMKKLGVDVAPVSIIDTQVAQWMINENHSLALKDLAMYKLGIREKLASYKDLLSFTKKLKGVKRLDQVTIYDIPLEILGPYAALDARLTYDLWELIYPELREEQQEDNYFSFQMPLLKVLLNMENNGALIDHDRTQELHDSFSKELEELTDDWDKRTSEIMEGDPVNFNSPLQLRVLLYDKLKLKTNRKTKSGLPSTDELTLIQLNRIDKSG